MDELRADVDRAAYELYREYLASGAKRSDVPKYKALSLIHIYLARGEGAISADLYEKYKVNRGLRDLNGKGVLTGLTEISEVKSSEEKDGVSVPCEGKLYYRGYDVNDLVRGFTGDGRFGYEECVYLLLFGVLPNKKELDDFTAHIESLRTLPSSFVRDIIPVSYTHLDVYKRQDASFPSPFRLIRRSLHSKMSRRCTMS